MQRFDKLVRSDESFNFAEFEAADPSRQRLDQTKLRRALASVMREEAVLKEATQKLLAAEKRLQDSERVGLELAKALKAVVENPPARTVLEAMRKVHQVGGV